MRIANLINKQKVVINDEKYVLESQIAEGGFAFVYHAKNKSTGASCAIKKILCQTEEQLLETRKEIEVLSAVKHTHIMELLGHTQQETKEQYVIYFLAMPKYDMSLQDMIDRGEAYPHCNISPLHALPTYLEQALVALSVMHQHGYRHNDFKTANLLVRHPSATPHLVLADMGSASPAITTITSRQEALAIQETAAIHTTASYRSPELYDTPSQCSITPASDVWSYGVTVYNLLYSKTPFEHKDGVSTLAIISCSFSLPATVEWPAAYTDIIHRCLCPMEKRASVNELLQLVTSLPPPEYTIVSVSPSPVAVHQPVSTTIENATTSSTSAAIDTNFADFAEFTSPTADITAGVADITIDIPIVDETSHLAASFNDVSAVDVLLEETQPPTVTSHLLSADKQPNTIEPVNQIGHSNSDGTGDEFRDSDFGDFVVAERTNSQCSPQKPAITTAGGIETSSGNKNIAQMNNNNATLDVESIHDEIPHCIGVIDAPILYQGPAFMMRRKKILLASKLVRKQVHMILTSQQLVIRKSALESSKIHLIGGLTRGIRLGKMTGKVGVYIDGIIQDTVPSQWEIEFDSYRVMEEWIGAIERQVELLAE